MPDIQDTASEGAATKALWAKCDKCEHCWPAAYYPLDLMTMGRLLKDCKCPKGCVGKPLLAKQDDGVLKEPMKQSEGAKQ